MVLARMETGDCFAFIFLQNEWQVSFRSRNRLAIPVDRFNATGRLRNGTQRRPSEQKRMQNLRPVERGKLKISAMAASSAGTVRIRIGISLSPRKDSRGEDAGGARDGGVGWGCGEPSEGKRKKEKGWRIKDKMLKRKGCRGLGGSLQDKKEMFLAQREYRKEMTLSNILKWPIPIIKLIIQTIL